uniref:Uncharacterized protein n=1 Tax=Asterionellopsis glacialis TaxID=33640 RepID=A0A7S0PVG7_9STRA|mmetsp:Transcript_1496/g.2087  ORF Transcript_1496/g.2087 Transcript_1496/m.2087 type:complete len:459 (+) Transcript_1496:22-1398(+)
MQTTTTTTNSNTMVYSSNNRGRRRQQEHTKPMVRGLSIPCEEDTSLPRGFKTTTLFLMVVVVLLCGQGLVMFTTVREEVVQVRHTHKQHHHQRALHQEEEKTASSSMYLRKPQNQSFVTNKNDDTTTAPFDLSDPLGWTSPWTGLQFESYKKYIDAKIEKQRRSPTTSHSHPPKESCRIPLYDGEYGYELAGIVPWAYWKFQHEHCQVHTTGRPGTKYLYYFSQKHTIQVKEDGLQRQSHSLPKESPFGQMNGGDPHFSNDKFPQEGWAPPPYKQFFERADVQLDKPLMVLSNKYTLEWSGEPKNNIPIRHLQEILKTLSQKYHIVYLRFQDKRLEDRLERKIRTSGKLAEYRDKEMIKRFFPSVVLFEELSVGLSLEDINLMLFSLYATGQDFISVQGGNSVVASFFGGRNLIFCEEGPELWNNKGDFTYYHRFSGAKIQIANNTTDFMKFVPQWYY